MSNREKCISILSSIDDDLLDNVVIMLQGVKNLVNETLDDSYCLKLYNEYLDDPDIEKKDTVPIDDFASELGIDLS